MTDHAGPAEHLDALPEGGRRAAGRIAQVEVVLGDGIECPGRERRCRPPAAGIDAGGEHQDRRWLRAHDFLDGG